MQILREWRGGIHLVATTAVGLSPLEAILTNEGPGQAKFFGWPEPFPDFGPIKQRHDEAEDITDRLCAVGAGRCPRRGQIPGLPRRGRHARAPPPRSGPQGFSRGKTNPGGARVRGCSAAGDARPRSRTIPRTCGAARSARRPVKAEVAGSNPVRSAAELRPASGRRDPVTRSGSSVGRARA